MLKFTALPTTNMNIFFFMIWDQWAPGYSKLHFHFVFLLCMHPVTDSSRKAFMMFFHWWQNPFWMDLMRKRVKITWIIQNALEMLRLHLLDDWMWICIYIELKNKKINVFPIYTCFWKCLVCYGMFETLKQFFLYLQRYTQMKRTKSFPA